jgi:hypothetical protein
MDMAAALDKFFKEIPKDDHYHLELRTELYLRDQIFEILEKHGVGQVLSHRYLATTLEEAAGQGWR